MRWVLLMLLLAPMAAAAPMPALYYLADGESPIAPGALSSEAPAEGDASIRMVSWSPDGPSAWFDAGEPAAERIWGPAFVGLWTQANVVAQGNLSASLWLVSDGESTMIAQKSLDIAVDPASLPEPASLVPPDPTDPEGAAFHAASQILPIITDPPLVYELGFIDVMVPANATLRLGFALEDGEVPAVGSSVLKYAAAASPSFLYVPWYAPDPPPSTSSPSSSQSPGSSSQSPGSSSSQGSSSSPGSSMSSQESSESSEAPDEDSPGFGLFALVAAVAVAFYVRRR